MCDSDFKRSIELSKIKALTKNIKKGNTSDFLVHVDGEYDYRFISNQREAIFKHIRESLFSFTTGELPIYGVDGGIEKYITKAKDRIKSQAKGLPPQEYRLYGDDAVNVVEASATERML